MDVNKLLDRVTEVCRSPTEKDLARTLGVTPAAVCNYRKGRALPDVVVCEKIANILEIKPLSLIAEINEAREISRDAKAVWRRLATAAALVIVLGLPTLPARARALEDGARAPQPMHYAKLKGLFIIVMRKLRRILRTSDTRLEISHAMA